MQVRFTVLTFSKSWETFMQAFAAPIPPVAEAPCFVCGGPLAFAEAAAVSGHGRTDEERRHIQFHRGCGPQLAAEALVSVSSPRRGSSMLPYFRHKEGPLLEEREKEILYCLASGLSNQEIGRQLGVSPHTARNLVSRLLVKLDASSRTEAAVWAVSHGIVATQSMLPLQADNGKRPNHQAQDER
jgi:DNA-binding CsgD family transcriptional regulator